ncbi:MAG: ribulose-phosphate 3-epimerase [Candidatus Cloacimonadaceae bacterium]
MQSKTIKIAPSLLSSDFGRLAEEIQAIEAAGADILHLDIMDGHYVPNLTFGYVIVETVAKLSKLPLDAHLMVTNPGDYVDRMAKLGIKYLSFHPDTVFHPHRLISAIKENGMLAGAALNPGTPVATLEELLPELDFVLLMSVNPGYSGQKFIPVVKDKIKQLKALAAQNNLSFLIEVDGGINATNAPELLKAGADIIVSASYIFNSKDYAYAIRSLRSV